MPDLQRAWSALSLETAQVLFIDLQPEIVARSKTTVPKALASSANVLLRFAQLFDLPTTMSVVPDSDMPPEVIEALRGADDFAPTLQRHPFSVFKDEQIVARLREVDRKVLIVSGFATEVAVLHAALDGIAEGYEVLVPVDACGGMSAATEMAAIRQIEAAGGVTTSVVSLATKMVPSIDAHLGEDMFALIQELRLA